MKKRYASFSSVLLVFLLIISGCSNNESANSNSSSSNGEDKITINFFHRWPNEPFNAYFNSVAEEFEKQNPNVNVEITTALNDQYKQKINVVLANENPPDVFFTWAGEYGENFVRSNQALNLTDYYNQDKEWANQIIPTALEPFKVEDQTYGVPLMMSAKLFYYNKSEFDKLGLEVPTTWSEFIDVLKTIKSKSDMTPLGLGNKAPWQAGAYLTTLNSRLVPADVLAKDYDAKTGEFTHPGYVEALKKLEELMPYTNEYPNAVSFEEERNMFINQEVAISYEETSGFRFFKDLPFDWGFFQLPEIEGGAGDPQSLTGAPEGFMVSSKTKHPEEAVAFLKFLTSTENAKKYVKETNYISAVKETVNEETSPHPLMVEAAKKISEAESMAQWIDTVTDSEVAKEYLAGVQQLLGNEKSPDEVMKGVQEVAKKVRDKQ